MAELNGKVAVVTGSTTGIGLGIAHHLAAKGSSLIITGLGDQDLIQSLLQDFRSKYCGKIEFVEGDLRDSNATLIFCDKVLELFPDGVDILVNNAGVIYNSNIDKMPLDKWNDMIAITLTASFLLIKRFLPKMKQKKWGRIINMSSQLGHVSSLGRAPYSTVKTGLIGLTKGVALEAAPLGITCNAICPGFVDAPLGRGHIQNLAKQNNVSYDEAKAMFARTGSPMQRLISIDEVAEMVIYLCSSGAASITGTSLLMDGGYTAK